MSDSFDSTMYVPAADLISRVCKTQILTAEMIWSTHDYSIWKADQFSGSPDFYPVYRLGDYYSYSPFLLSLHRGYLQLNSKFLERFRETDKHAPIDSLIDADIVRVGGPPVLTNDISDRREFIAAITSAMQEDIEHIESMNRGKTNYILCGGKDSLNLLLLNWTNETVVLSADPNFALVQQFISENGLDFPVELLTDIQDPGIEQREVAECFCRFDMQHMRWGVDLAQIARKSNYQSVFWTGALGDVFLTPYWQSYTARGGRFYSRFRTLCRYLIRRCPVKIAAKIAEAYVLPEFREALWKRGAAWQGGYIGQQRAVTNCLFLSAYHGRRTAAVWQASDLVALSRLEDLRDEMGAELLGKTVRYPTQNPGPPGSSFRSGLNAVDRFLDCLNAIGLPIREVVGRQ